MTTGATPGPPPLVTFGVPAFNGAKTIGRALDSILAQTMQDFEVVIADNASTDGTPELCEVYAARDPRIRLYRSDVNRGPTPNFARCLHEARGRYFLWLACDDDLEAGYAAACVAELEAFPRAVLVAGRTVYHRSTGEERLGSRVELTATVPWRRVLRYFRTLSDNASFYGVYRRELIAGVALTNMLGGDWLWLAEVACLGEVRYATSARLHREDSAEGTPYREYYARLVRMLGLPPFYARIPRIVIALGIGHAILRRSSVFARVPWPARLLVAGSATALLSAKFARDRAGALARAVARAVRLVTPPPRSAPPPP